MQPAMITKVSEKGFHWYSSDTFTSYHGMFTRQGGTSNAPYNSLNLSFGVGDKRAAVLKNRDQCKQLLGIEFLVSSKQVHGDNVAKIQQINSDLELSGYDALITRQPGIGLLIQQADCQAVLLHDPEKQAIAAIHNGWRGSVTNIIAKTIASLQQHFQSRPEDLRAVISPSLGPCCGEFINYQQELPPAFLKFQTTAQHFDFWAISRWQLEQTGIKADNIITAGICTACNKDFFSYRRAMKNGNGVTGRNGSVIALP